MIKLNLIYPRWYHVLFGSLAASKAWIMLRALGGMARERGVPRDEYDLCWRCHKSS